MATNQVLTIISYCEKKALKYPKLFIIYLINKELYEHY